MANASVFAQLRTFSVGLESNARAIREALESSDKNCNGNGLFKFCDARSPEDEVQQMISDVAEEDIRLKRIEEMMRTQEPRREIRERCRRLCEYNQAAFEDLEERLAEVIFFF
ncbi:unnamed protein product [Discosporangium mesarthrocarpum]